MSLTNKPKIVTAQNLLPFILITSCFAWWGLANNMTDTLLSAFKRIKSMSDVETSLIQMAFYGAYFCFALPAALFIKKYSYKSGVLLGLALFIIGGLIFYPASKTQEYGHFLFALYILAGGLSVLETSANPYIMEFGDRQTATQRLNLAQSFNPIGSISGVIISKFFILSGLQNFSAEERSSMGISELKAIQTGELEAVMGPYVVVSFLLLVTWIFIAVVKMPMAKDTNVLHLSKSIKRLVKNRSYVFGVVAQFFYVGAQIGIWSFTIRYVMQELNILEADASSFYIAALITFVSFRFFGTWLMSYLRPEKVLWSFAMVAMACTLIVIFTGGWVGVIAQILISGCMSVMFPTIYGISLHHVDPEDFKIGGSGLIMSIVGGAITPVIQGYISDSQGINASFSVPLICFAVVFAYAYSNLKIIPGKNTQRI